MKVKISDSTKPFSFVANTSDIKTMLTKVEQVTGYSGASDTEKTFLFAILNEKLFILGYSPETFVLVRVPASDVSKGSSCFGFIPSVVSGLIAGRGEMKFSYDGQLLKVSATKGRYTCDILTRPITDDQLPRINKNLNINADSAKSLDTETLSLLRAGIKYAELKDVYAESGKSSLLCLISLRKGLLTIDSFDNFHLSSYRTKVDTDEHFRLAIAEQTFALIEKFFTQDTDAKFFISDTGLRVQNSEFIVSLPSVQVDDEQYSMVSNYLKSLNKPNISLGLSKDAVTTVNNMLTIAGKDSRFEFAVSPKGAVQLSLAVDGGTVQDTFKCKELDMGKISKPVKFKIDPRLFVDLFRKLKGESSYPLDLHFSKDQEEAASCFVTRCTLSKTSKLILLGTYHV